jgi:mannan endo-1,4-beta-mannosidase
MTVSDTKLKNIFHKPMTRKEFLGLSVFALASLFGIVGIIEELKSHAASISLSEEPETGTVKSPATIVTDASASGGKAIKFGTATNPSSSGITVSGGRLQLNGVTTRFSGLNAFQLGTDVSGSTDFIPSDAQIDQAFTGLTAMGCSMLRGHTLGINAGLPVQYMTGVTASGGIYNDANLSAADRSLYQAKQHNIYLMAVLVDDYNYYEGGKWNFIHFAFQQNPSGITDVTGANGNEDQFYATTPGGLRIRALFKDYISHWLNHTNAVTGVKYKDDPYLALIETGNEINTATAEWTQDICAYIKSIAPNKLTVDGSGVSWGPSTANQAGLGQSAVDILSQHYYPNSSQTMASFTGQLASDVAAAKSHNQAFIIGEYPWTQTGFQNWWTLMESTDYISFDAAWAFTLNTSSGSPEGGGSGFGTADCRIHAPYSGSTETTYGPELTSHIIKITGRPRGTGY